MLTGLARPLKEGERIKLQLTFERAGTIEDVTQAVLFCLQNNFMTGETIVLDGGRSLR